MKKYEYVAVIKLMSGHEIFAYVDTRKDDGSLIVKDPMIMVTTAKGSFILNRYIMGIEEQVVEFSPFSVMSINKADDLVTKYYNQCVRLSAYTDNVLDENIKNAIETIEKLDPFNESSEKDLKGEFFDKFLESLDEKEFTKQ